MEIGEINYSSFEVITKILQPERKMNVFAFALRNLTHRKTRTALTLLGVVIGIAAVVSLIGLGEGLRSAIVSQFNFLGSDVLSLRAAGVDYAGPPGTGAVKPLTDDLPDKISKVSGVEAVIARYIESATLEFNDRQTIGFVGSMPEGKNRKIIETMINLKTERGRLLKDDDAKEVVLGNNFLDDKTFGRKVEVGSQILINNIKFVVVGILEKKGNFLLDSSVLVNEGTVIDLLGADKNKISVIAVKVKNVNKISTTKEDIEVVLRKERGVKEGEEDFVIETPQKILETIDSTLFAVQLFIYLIAAVSLVVGGIGIMNAMYTAVLERTKEIGIMKSIGARNSTIFSLFFIESGFLGAVGGFIGIVIGLGLSYGLAYAGRITLGSDLIQAHVSLFVIVSALAFSFIIGTIFGVLPAYQASKLQPIESLRDVK
jgi:putative ABC transport system permease protein